MKILITGGTGFIGMDLINLLYKHQFEIKVFSRSANSKLWPPGIMGYSGSISDFEKLKELIDWSDIILHLSCSTNPKLSKLDPEFEIINNLIPSVKIIDYLKKYSQKKIIFISSGGTVYGDYYKNSIREDTQKIPTSPYGITKSTIEDYIQYYHRHYNLQFLIIRISNVYGPKKSSINSQGIISTLIINAINNNETNIWGNLENVRDYIYINDCVKGIMELIKINAKGIFNLGSGKGYPLSQVIKIIQNHFEHSIRIQYSGDEKCSKNVLNIEKIASAINWKPEITLEEGIKLTISSLKESNSLEKPDEGKNQIESFQ